MELKKVIENLVKVDNPNYDALFNILSEQRKIHISIDDIADMDQDEIVDFIYEKIKDSIKEEPKMKPHKNYEMPEVVDKPPAKANKNSMREYIVRKLAEQSYTRKGISQEVASAFDLTEAKAAKRVRSNLRRLKEEGLVDVLDNGIIIWKG